ncbi:MAG: hypothetical protein J7L45_00250 [Candidatus Aenigmarchaeota archaeon]|nr:hypothetical protein [Candidatus Aenigmarchaeota archaeon]
MSEDVDIYEPFLVYNEELYINKVKGSNEFYEVIRNFAEDVERCINRVIGPKIEKKDRIFLLYSKYGKSEIRIHGHNEGMVRIIPDSLERGAEVDFYVVSMEDGTYRKIIEEIDKKRIEYMLKYDGKSDVKEIVGDNLLESLKKINIDEEIEKRLQEGLGDEYKKIKWALLADEENNSSGDEDE